MGWTPSVIDPDSKKVFNVTGTALTGSQGARRIWIGSRVARTSHKATVVWIAILFLRAADPFVMKQALRYELGFRDSPAFTSGRKKRPGLLSKRPKSKSQWGQPKTSVLANRARTPIGCTDRRLLR